MSWPYGTRWARMVADLQAQHLLCTIRLPDVCTGIATTLDHHPVGVARIRAARPRLDHLAYDPANLRPSCAECNHLLGSQMGGRAPHPRRRLATRTPTTRPPATGSNGQRPAQQPIVCQIHGTACGSNHSRDW